MAVAVVVVLVALAVGNSVPTVVQSERGNANTAHDAEFLQALHYLSGAPGNGSVLTLEDSIRWTEAVTDRGAFDVGPTWLLFEPWQIVNAEETYWAYNSEFAMTNNGDVLSYSGGYQGVDSGALSTAPLYSVYAEGVGVPMIEFQTAGFLVNATSGGVARLYAAGSWGAPTLELPTTPGGSAVLRFTGPLFNLTVTGSVAPGAGAGANLGFSLVPEAGVTIGGLDVALASPDPAVALLHAPAAGGVRPTASGLDWSMNATLGPDTFATELTSVVTCSPAPRAVVGSAPGQSNAAAIDFGDPGGEALDVQLALTTSGTGGNPAIVLPSDLNTSEFLSEHNIRYLLLPRSGMYGATVQFYERAYGARPLYANSEWQVLTA